MVSIGFSKWYILVGVLDISLGALACAQMLLISFSVVDYQDSQNFVEWIFLPTPVGYLVGAQCKDLWGQILILYPYGTWVVNIIFMAESLASGGV